MIVRPCDVHDNPEMARLGVGLVCEALGLACNMKLQSMWLISGNEPVDSDQFLELAREAAKKGKI